MSNIQTFICEQIANVPDRDPQFDKTTIMIKCPYHSGGNERTPSFKINLEGSRYPVGTGYCYACKKRTEWNDLATTLGVQTLKQSSVVHDIGHFSFLDKTILLPDLKKMLDWPDQDWRGIRAEVLHKFGGKLEFRHREVMLYLPVLMGNEYVGGVHCVMEISSAEKATGKKAYLNTDGEWAHSALFGYNHARKQSGPLIVVEGPRDALNVHQLGGRVVGMLSAAVTPAKVKLITRINPPYIISLFDPDTAGDLAHVTLKKSLEDSYIPVIRVRLPENKDPADLTPKSFNKVMRIAENKRTTR